MPPPGPRVPCRKIAEQIHNLQLKEEEIKQALVRCKKEKKTRCRRRRHLEQVALHVMCQSGGSHTVTQEFLESSLGEQGVAAVTDTFVAVVATYEGMSVDEIKAVRELTGLGTTTAPARTAARFLKECRLSKWIQTRNMEQRIAPVVALVAQEARATNCLPPEPRSSKHKSQLQWLRRWRKRWNISLGSIPAREDIPPAEARQKVSNFEEIIAGGLKWTVFWSTFMRRMDPKMGSIIWTLFWVRCSQTPQRPRAIFWPPFWTPRQTFLENQATAVWHWSNFLHAHIPPHETAVVVNMDETSIRLYQKPGHGYMVQVARKQKRSPKSLTRNITKGQLLGTFTHAAMICDDVDLQPHLPQFLFINRTQISQTEFDSIHADWLPNVYAHRVDNPWMTCEKMKVVLKGLADAVASHSKHRRVVLCADAHKTHIATSTWQSAAAHNVFYFIVPPKLTWALQPCDTHLFAMFKDKLTTTCQHLAILNGRRRWDILLLLKALNTSIGEVLNKRSWRKAFEDLGYRGNQRNVSKRVLDKVDLTERPEVPNGIPNLQSLMSCFPQRTNIPIGHVFSAVLQADRLVQELAKRQHPGPAAREIASSSSSRLPHPHLVRLKGFRPLATHSGEVSHAEGASPSATSPTLVPRLARLGSSQRLVSQAASHEGVRPPLPPPLDPPPGMP